MPMTLTIVEADVWLGRERGFAKKDVRIEDGVIVEVGQASTAAAGKILDGRGKWLIPGVIDAHVHFRDPGHPLKEDLHSGSVACAAGGVTTFLEMPNTDPATDTTARLDEKLEAAATKSLVNYGFFIGATRDNLDEVRRAEKACGIKVFMGSSTGNLLLEDGESLERLFAKTDPGAVIALHCEDESRVRARAHEHRHRSDPMTHSLVRDDESALLATARALDLAERHAHRAHILHVSTAKEVELLLRRPEEVTAECAPHHLLFDTGAYERLGGLVKMNPSLKSAEDRAALWRGLSQGAIDCVATDHAPHTLEEKSREDIRRVPSGIPAVENSLGLLLSAASHGMCSVDEALHWLCTAPAEVYRLEGKGCIAEGFDADLCLFDPRRRHTILNENQWTRCRWSPWHETAVIGWPVTTIVGGRIAFEGGRPDLDCRGTPVKRKGKG